MKYSEFLCDIINRAEMSHPLYFNKRARKGFEMICDASSGVVLNLLEKLLDWSWYTPGPLKIARLIMAGGGVAAIIRFFYQNKLLNLRGISAVQALGEIKEEYRERFYSCQDDLQEIKHLQDMAYTDLISRL